MITTDSDANLLLNRYGLKPEKTTDSKLGFQTGSTQSGSKREQLTAAFEKLNGRPPNAFEKFLYNWLTVAQIEEELKNFATLEELRAANP